MIELYNENDLTIASKIKRSIIYLIAFFVLFVALITLTLIFIVKLNSLVAEILCILFTTFYFFFLFIQLSDVILVTRNRLKFLRNMLYKKQVLEKGIVITNGSRTKTNLQITFYVVDVMVNDKPRQLLSESVLPLNVYDIVSFLVVDGVIIAYEK